MKKENRIYRLKKGPGLMKLYVIRKYLEQLHRSTLSCRPRSSSIKVTTPNYRDSVDRLTKSKSINGLRRSEEFSLSA